MLQYCRYLHGVFHEAGGGGGGEMQHTILDLLCSASSEALNDVLDSG